MFKIPTETRRSLICFSMNENVFCSAIIMSKKLKSHRFHNSWSKRIILTLVKVLLNSAGLDRKNLWGGNTKEPSIRATVANYALHFCDCSFQLWISSISRQFLPTRFSYENIDGLSLQNINVLLWISRNFITKVLERTLFVWALPHLAAFSFPAPCPISSLVKFLL